AAHDRSVHASEAAASAESLARLSERAAARGLRDAKIRAPFTGEIARHETNQILVGHSDSPLNTPQALRHMGHHDLADTWERRRAAKIGLIFGGAFMAVGLPVGGAMLLLADMEPNGGSPGYKAGAGAALGIGVTGAAVLITGLALRKGVTDDDMRDYVRSYNSELQSGLQEERSDEERVSFEWSLAPSASRQGGGLVLSGRF
ncbi:MAG: hypothetical protein KC457_35190, partial [Myxococcales bacterium]|nr:hypothetical protein [Myxococcales bacterium]